MNDDPIKLSVHPYLVQTSTMPYIVYVHFETRCSDPMIASIIAGSLQLATTESEAEAVQMTEMYKKRSADFRAQYPFPETDTSRHGYYFWPHPL